jgi:hypothetical protein
MKRLLSLIVLLIAVCAGCGSSTGGGLSSPAAEDVTITVTFEHGDKDASYANIYTAWIQNSDASFVQNLAVCAHVKAQDLTGTLLPFWETNVRPHSSSAELDAVTSATKAKTDFTVSAVLKDSSIRKFTLYFETDRSGDSNDWFTGTYGNDQPALLYSADIDLDNGADSYALSVAGWTPNENTIAAVTGTVSGVLQSEMRYITNFKDGTSFGGTDDRAATRMVKKITVRVR